MRIVLDTNVLVAGFISPSGPPGAILRSILAGGVTVCFDERILAEYRDVLTRSRFSFDGDRVAEVLDLIEAMGEPVLAEDLGIALPDVADAMFVEVATACLVTGNRRHFPNEQLPGMRVLLPREFLDHVRDSRRRPST